jgi:hypothetical protein
MVGIVIGKLGFVGITAGYTHGLGLPKDPLAFSFSKRRMFEKVRLAPDVSRGDCKNPPFTADSRYTDDRHLASMFKGSPLK